MKKKKGFTLVELLAVIVILAVILIIAMPKISDVIKNSKEASLETTAKLIASQAEKKYTENQILDGSSVIKCSDVAKINSNDYESCNITFDDKGNAKVSIVGKGKFEGLQVVDGTKDSAKASAKKEIAETATKYFSYEDTPIIHSAEIVDIDKCKTFMQNPVGCTEAQANTFCTTGSLTINNKTLTVNDLALEVSTLEDYSYETIGLKVDATEGIKITGYNIAGGTDVVIPSQVDGKTVVTIGDNAFTTGGIIPTLTAYNNDYKVSLLSYDSNNNYVVKPLASGGVKGLGITSVIIPNTVTSIGESAFERNNLINVEIPSSVTTIKVGAFANNKLTNVEIPSSITGIGDYAFAYNKITSITFPDTPITLGCEVFYGNPIMEDGSYSFPSNVTEVCE